MPKRSIIGALVLLLTGAVFAQAYKWVDEDGIVHYSDRPHPGAEIIQLPSSNSLGTPRASTPTPRYSRSRNEEPPEQDEGPFSYDSLEVISPAPEQTIWNIEGVLSVTLDLRPALRPGHQVRAYFDGTPQIVSGTRFRIQDVYRGAHNLQVEILDENGTLMIRSLPNRFYVQQNSVARLN